MNGSRRDSTIQRHILSHLEQFIEDKDSARAGGPRPPNRRQFCLAPCLPRRMSGTGLRASTDRNHSPCSGGASALEAASGRARADVQSTVEHERELWHAATGFGIGRYSPLPPGVRCLVRLLKRGPQYRPTVSPASRLRSVRVTATESAKRPAAIFSDTASSTRRPSGSRPQKFAGL